MTSDEFVQYIRHQKVFKELGESFDPLEIFLHGTLAQSEILRETEILTDTASVVFTANQEVYTSAASGWEFLEKTLRIISGVNASHQPIVVRGKVWIDQVRGDNAAHSATEPSPPIAVYQKLTSPISLGFFGVPTSASAATLDYVRVAGPGDAITADTNPIIPAQWDELLIVGTTWKLLRGKAFKDVRGVGRGKMYENLLAALGEMGSYYQSLKNSAMVKRAALTGQDATIYRRMKI